MIGNAVPIFVHATGPYTGTIAHGRTSVRGRDGRGRIHGHTFPYGRTDGHSALYGIRDGTRGKGRIHARRYHIGRMPWTNTHIPDVSEELINSYIGEIGEPGE